MSEAIATLAALNDGRRTLALEVARSLAARQLATAQLRDRQRHHRRPVRRSLRAALRTGHIARCLGSCCAAETLAILGRNGAGKTTLGATLAGLLRPRQGRRSGPMGGICFQNPES